MKSLELEGAFKGNLDQLPCNEQGHLQIDHYAQSGPVWPRMFPGMGHSTPLSRQPVKDFFLISSLTLSYFSLKPFPVVLSQQKNNFKTINSRLVGNGCMVFKLKKMF